MKKKVIVIGAGLGGMSAAISLASKGHEVQVYEKNSKVGGKLNVLKKQGFTFDLGPSILTMPQIFEKLFKENNKNMEDYVEIQKIDLQWKSFFEDHPPIDLYDTPEKTVKANKLSQEDREGLKEYAQYSKKLYETTKKGYFDEGLDTFTEVMKFHGVIGSLRDFDYFHTMHQGVEKRVKNPHLVKTIDFFIKYVGSSPYDAPAVLNLLPHVQFEYGLWYVKGGMYNLARGLEKLMQEVGVEIHLNSEVVGMNQEGSKITSITLADKTEKTADVFVSNMEVIPLYKKLLEQDVQKYEKKFEPACSGMVLHLGVDKKYDQLAHHNFFFSKNPEKHFKTVFHDKQLPEDPTIYLVASTRTDPSQAPKGHENIKVLPHIPYLQDEPFTKKEYQQLKQNVLEKLERMGLKDLRKHTVVEDVWFPEDIQKNYYSNRGAIYGVVSDKKKNKGFKAPKKSEYFENLYFVGGSVNPGGGMPMVTLSGQQVRDEIVKNERV
jgi:diapolycopene oxygenase